MSTYHHVFNKRTYRCKFCKHTARHKCHMKDHVFNYRQEKVMFLDVERIQVD